MKNKNKNLNYSPRLCDKILEEKLETMGGVLIEGPKWCGKTTTGAHHCKSVLYVDDPASKANNIQIAKVTPQLLLEGETPRLFDEWQLAPQLWDAARFEIDARQTPGQFMFAGSTTPVDKSILSHSGTGRIARMRMRTMSLFESGNSSGKISLKALFEGDKTLTASRETGIEEIAHLTCRGGWPAICSRSNSVSLNLAKEYLASVIEADVSDLGPNRSPALIRSVLRSYARFISSQGKMTEILKDVNTNNHISIDILQSCIDVLKAMFVIDELDAWNPNLRSSSAVRTTNVRHFCDSSIAAAALGATPSNLIGDLNTFGLLFESLCVHDLRVYMDSLGGNVSHYRDSSGLESDAVLHTLDGRYALIEVKLGGSDQIEKGTHSLLKLQSVIDEKSVGSPAFMAVVVGVGNYAYCREDGVYVIPVTCLRD